MAVITETPYGKGIGSWMRKYIDIHSQEGQTVLINAEVMTGVEAAVGFLKEDWWRRIADGVKSLVIINYENAEPYVQKELLKIFKETMREDDKVFILKHNQHQTA